MDIAIVTGSLGLVGAESVRFLTAAGLKVIGVDNNMRREFFGNEASTEWNRKILEEECPGYDHHSLDIRSETDMERLFAEHDKDIKLIIHAAAQPSHDWAQRAPLTDFTVNANGTLNLLEMTRKHCPDAVFIYLSTNKVYGDRPNSLPLVEHETRWELEDTHPFFTHGIDESMSIDDSTHSLFGVSKAAADLLVQEYGRNFGIKTACFRGGCLTGPLHSGAELHGFLSYLMICAMKKKNYTVFGFKCKQVRDNIHSRDLIEALYAFYRKPGTGKVYNMGGGRFSNCSILEAIALCEKITGNTVEWTYEEKNRIGDHIWWVSDCGRFKNDYPEWKQQAGIEKILEEIHEGLRSRL
ncbi:NAD-dependent epimerase [Candidatus Nitromaritima sp. SCGC AAA799-C22]|nr:NAD-dependent epimerase [Candidatus Nitromaritima sp. SCGC AAA799-C22]